MRGRLLMRRAHAFLLIAQLTITVNQGFGAACYAVPLAASFENVQVIDGIPSEAISTQVLLNAHKTWASTTGGVGNQELIERPFGDLTSHPWKDWFASRWMRVPKPLRWIMIIDAVLLTLLSIVKFIAFALFPFRFHPHVWEVRDWFEACAEVDRHNSYFFYLHEFPFIYPGLLLLQLLMFALSMMVSPYFAWGSIPISLTALIVYVHFAHRRQEDQRLYREMR